MVLKHFIERLAQRVGYCGNSFLADRLILFEPLGADYAHHLSASLQFFGTLRIVDEPGSSNMPMNAKDIKDTHSSLFEGA